MIKELKITDEKLQNVGLRPLITAVMMENSFKKGFVRNNSDGSVSVFAEDTNDLEKLKDALNQEIEKEAHKSYSNISKDFKLSDWADPNPHPPELMDLSSNFNDMLNLRQVTKGASVMQNGFENTIKILNELPENIAKAIEKTNSKK
ncbi:MAG: hypothetical protein ISS93_02090 [Candidatus Aenigmarchaeota archaeon]|nr:hypothetical protein [Candidatus Aenigmarchaeota archaeon]